MLCCAVLCCAVLCCAVLCCAVLCRKRCAVLCCPVLCYVASVVLEVLCCVVLEVLCCAMLCQHMLSQAMPCHAMPCHAMPCHAMLCCAVLWQLGQSRAATSMWQGDISTCLDQQCPKRMFFYRARPGSQSMLLLPLYSQQGRRARLVPLPMMMMMQQ